MGLAIPEEERDDGGQELVMTLNPENTKLDGARFICRVTLTSGERFEETVTLQVKGSYSLYHTTVTNVLIILSHHSYKISVYIPCNITYDFG